MILPIWQPYGYSTHIIAKNVAKKHDVSTSHTGTLDPMAQGVIIVLLGSERLKKYEYATWSKTYEFEIAFGISTDSFDFLGLITHTNFSRQLSETPLKETLESFKGAYTQKVPPFSAIKMQGKSLHWYARHQKLDKITVPTKTGEIFAIKLQAFYTKRLCELISVNLEKVAAVTGDLRQAEVTQKWLLFSKECQLQMAKICVKMTKGLYVRALSQDICARLGVCGFVSDLVRIQNGIYTQSIAQTLVEIFGQNFKNKYDFVSRSIY